MTIFGWDASHYDGELDKATLTLAKREGIEFFTHKIGEGLSNTDTTAARALTAARDAGIRVIGGYYFIHSGDMAAQAARCVRLANQMVPWWRQFPGWMWQVDAETDTGGHLPSSAEVKAFADELDRLTHRCVIVYASHGQYGQHLAGLGRPLWNANYPTSRRGPFKDLYPGDGFLGWALYSGQVPVICQYASSATIAGKATCDANAYRGTIDQLLTLIGANPMATEPVEIDMHQLLTSPAFPYAKPATATSPAVVPHISLGTTWLSTANDARDALDQAKANGSSLTEIKAAVTALGATAGGGSTGGQSIDLDALAAAVAGHIDLDALAAKIDGLIAARYAS